MSNAARKIVPLEEIEVEIKVVNSRFIASLAYAASVEGAREHIRIIKERYPGASHHVPAFLIGQGQSVTAHCTDDGEPSGTAGRPALAVLQGSGIGDAVVVVTRYFGGTKLGTGGLVRAYGDAVRTVLQHAKLAEIVSTSMVRLSVGYSHYEPVKRLLERRHAIVEEEQFAGDVTLFVRIVEGQEKLLENDVMELSAGRVVVNVIRSGEDFKIPIENSLAASM